MPSVFHFAEGRFSFTREDVGGWVDLTFRLNDTLAATLPFTHTETAGGLIAVGHGPQHEERLEFTHHPGEDSLIVRRFVTNIGADPLPLTRLEDGKLDAAGRIDLVDANQYTMRYVHTENARNEIYPDSRPGYPYVQPMPYDPVHFNLGEGGHYPAFLITDESYAHTLLEGDLDQTRFERSWELGIHGDPAERMPIRTYRAHEVYPLAAPRVLAPGETLEVSRVFYQLLAGVHPQEAYVDYTRALRRFHTFAVEHSPMLHGSVFCTWNYGTLENITDEIVVRRAQALAARIPEATHFLIDDGYQANRQKMNGPIDCFYPIPREGYDRERFPRGMRAVADDIRATGLVPCIWLSPAVRTNSQLALDHPDWLLRDAAGSPDLIGMGPNKAPCRSTTFLDLSVPAARAFFLEVLDALFIDWGFQGLKFDFMTHWFTMAKARFGAGSGLEWREDAFAEVRKRIGPEGLFMTCIAMSMGNPFPGRYADCYRAGCDIHDGTWPEQRRACKATLPQVLLEGRQTMLLNMDSAGFGDNPPHEQLFRLTWLFITQGILEFAGPIEEMPEEQIRRFRTLLAHPDRGHKVRCLDERAFTGEPFPEILSVVYPPDSHTAARGVRAHLAFFNWQESARMIGGTRAHLGLQPGDTLWNVWQETPVEIGDDLFLRLEPHAAALLEVRKK